MKRFLFLIGCLFSAIASASTWQLANFTDNWDPIFFDRDSVVRVMDDTIRVQTAIVLHKDFPLKRKPYSFNLLITLREIDIKNRAIRELRHVFYKDGEIVKTYEKPTAWVHIEERTAGEDFFEQVLGNRLSIFRSTQCSLSELVSFGREIARSTKSLVDMAIEKQGKTR